MPFVTHKQLFHVFLLKFKPICLQLYECVYTLMRVNNNKVSQYFV